MKSVHNVKAAELMNFLVFDGDRIISACCSLYRWQSETFRPPSNVGKLISMPLNQRR